MSVVGIHRGVRTPVGSPRRQIEAQLEPVGGRPLESNTMNSTMNSTWWTMHYAQCVVFCAICTMQYGVHHQNPTLLYMWTLLVEQTGALCTVHYHYAICGWTTSLQHCAAYMKSTWWAAKLCTMQDALSTMHYAIWGSTTGPQHIPYELHLMSCRIMHRNRFPIFIAHQPICTVSCWDVFTSQRDSY